MPKSIDSIGPSPNKKNVKPIVEHKAGEIVRPKGAAPEAGELIKPKDYVDPKRQEINVGKPKPPKRQIKKKQIVLGLVGLVLVLLLSIASIWLIRGTRLLESLTKPKPSPGMYAEVGGQSASINEFDKLKKSYAGFNAKQSSPLGDTAVAQQASKDLVTYLALKAAASKNGIECTQTIVDNRLASKYAEKDGKDAFYAFLKSEYGWDPEVTFVKECSEYYRAELNARVVGGTDVFGVYVRWDRLSPDAPSAEKLAYEAAAKKRLEQDFAPLFARGASKEEIYRRADISPYTSDAEFDQKMKTPGEPYVRTVEYPMFNDYLYAQFQKYSEGDDDTTYIAKLEKGDNTPVFKSKVGYYAIFRATDKKVGATQSVDQLVEQYLAEGKYSSQYYTLPPAPTKGTTPQYDLNNVSANTIVDRITQAIVPKALAANSVGCFTGFHALPMRILYSDYYTGQDVPLKQIRDNKGAPVATLQISSTGDVQTPCYDEPPSINGAFGVMNIGYFGGALAYDVYDHQNNPWDFSLSCYTAWRFYFNKVVGYEPVNYQDASQFEVWLAAQGGGMNIQKRASAYPDYYRIPSDMWQTVANGASGYAIRVFLRKEPPPQQTKDPYMTIQGYKVDEARNPVGPYAGATIREQPDGVASSAQPYFLQNLRADRYHEITPDPVAGYDVIGYLLDGSNDVQRASKYIYTAGTRGDGQALNLWWVYRKRPTVDPKISCATISGTVQGGGAGVIVTRLRLGGDLLPEEGGRDFNFTVPEKYRDGEARTAEIRVYVDGEYFGVLGSGTHRCVPDAQCSVPNFNALAGSVDANTEYKVQMTMRNTGEAIWNNYGASNNYRLALITGTNSFESPALQELQLDRPPEIQAPVRANGNASFTVNLKTKAIPTEAVINYSFKMVRDINGTLDEFGTACSGQTRLRSTYGPWLRTQNGNVTAIGKIVGQDPLTAVGGNRGGRREAATNGTKDDLNKEATYTVISFAGSSGPFCSTNTYNLGRDADASSSPSSCDFDKYTANLDINRVVDAIYGKAVKAYDDSPTACPAGGPNQTGAGRYVRIDVPNGSQLSANAGTCATIGKLNGVNVIGNNNKGNLAQYSNPGPPKNLTYTGRRTILVDGDLFIGANIRRDTSTPDVSFDVNTMNELNSLPNLGIMVKGDIIIDEGVTQIDAMLYATGKIRTCDRYDPSGSKDENSNISNGFKPEAPLPPAVPLKNTDAARCSKTLVVNGLVAAKDGFNFGRNYIDFAGIGSRIGRQITDPNYEIQTATDYYGGPAEDLRFNGIALFLPPPGFENLFDQRFTNARYETDSAQPKF